MLNPDERRELSKLRADVLHLRNQMDEALYLISALTAEHSLLREQANALLARTRAA